MTLLIHPGFHKTATTWLQKSVFSDETIFRSLLSHDEINDLFVAPHDFLFDADHARGAVTERQKGGQSGITDVISSEILSGNILYGSRDCRVVAERVATLGQPAKVLLTVRAQPTITRSIYMQYVKRGGRLGLREFLSFQPEPGYDWFEPLVLEFDRLAQTYAELFGWENVLVLPQELLRSDRDKYLRTLFEFADVANIEEAVKAPRASSGGVSPPASGMSFLRAGNISRQSALNPGPAGAMSAVGSALSKLGYRWTLGKDAAEKRMMADISELMEGRYARSNARLQQFAPVDLGALGYEMES